MLKQKNSNLHNLPAKAGRNKENKNMNKNNGISCFAPRLQPGDLRYSINFWL